MHFFFNDTATTEIYTLSLHDALPIFEGDAHGAPLAGERGEDRLADPPDGVADELHPLVGVELPRRRQEPDVPLPRSEEHTSELQSRQYLVCRLLLEKK